MMHATLCHLCRNPDYRSKEGLLLFDMRICGSLTVYRVVDFGRTRMG
jgi:hypothetical protein